MFQIGAVVFWLGMIAFLLIYIDTNNLTLAQFVARLENTMREMWYGPVLFLLVLIVLRPFTLIPTIVFATLGGRLFGLGWGFIYCLIGSTLTAILPYYFGRLFANSLEQRRHTTENPRHMGDHVANFLQRNPFESLLALRLINAPFDLVSFMAGRIVLPFRIYMLATLLGNISSVYGFTALGASIEGNILRGDYQINVELVASSVVVLLLSVIVSLYLRRRARHKGTGAPHQP
ncbi:MAG: TVP38/TMEM64 family protein [Chloroflexota bacterium]